MNAARNLKTLALWKKSYEKPDSILKSRDINLLTKVCIVKVRFFSSLIQTWQRRQCHPTPVLLPGKSHGRRSLEGCSPWGCWGSDMTERLHFHFHALEKEMATRSSVLAWRLPGTGEPGGLPSMGSHRVGRDWSDLAAAAAVWWHYHCSESVVFCHK